MANARRLARHIRVIPAVATLVLMATSAGAQRAIESSSANPVSRQQLENMEARIAAALAIVNRFEPEAKAKGRAAAWRQVTLESLLALPLTALDRLDQEAVNIDSLAALTANLAEDPGVFGSSTTDLVFSPITPCRFVDTRVVGGKLLGNRGYSLGSSVYGGSVNAHAICARVPGR